MNEKKNTAVHTTRKQVSKVVNTEVYDEGISTFVLNTGIKE